MCSVAELNDDALLVDRGGNMESAEPKSTSLEEYRKHSEKERPVCSSRTRTLAGAATYKLAVSPAVESQLPAMSLAIGAGCAATLTTGHLLSVLADRLDPEPLSGGGGGRRLRTRTTPHRPSWWRRHRRSRANSSRRMARNALSAELSF